MINIVHYIDMQAALQRPDIARSGKSEVALPEQFPAAGAAECTPILLHQAPEKKRENDTTMNWVIFLETTRR